MIPPLAEVVAAHAWMVRRIGVDERIDARALGAALAEAATLAADAAAAAPAALFYVLTRRPRLLRSTWRPLPRLLAINQARVLGLRLLVEDAEWRELRLDIAEQLADWGAVRAWFLSRGG